MNRLIFLAPLAIVSCATTPTPRQTLYAVESAYTMLANDEATAIKAKVVPAAVAAKMKAIDSQLYADLLVYRTAVEGGASVKVATLTSLKAGLGTLRTTLASNLSAQTAGQVQAAIALLQTAIATFGGV